MKFTDVFIHRPVLATVVSLLILLIGARAMSLLELRQYPELNNTVVTVTTAYPGASSELVKGFITQPLQQAIAEAEGIDYIKSTSSQGTSTIEVFMELNYDPNAAVAEIQAKVGSQRNVLPQEAQDPVIESSTGSTTALMYLAFYSEAMPVPQITDYLARVVQPQLQALPGVAKARLIGKPFAMRIWLDPNRMSALGVSASDVVSVLRANNYIAGVGSTKGTYVSINLKATTDVSQEEDFQDLVVSSEDGTLVRLRDVADAELGAEEYTTEARYRGIPGVFVAIEQAPGSNPLDVAKGVQDIMPSIQSQLPEELKAQIPYDASEFINDSIDEVFKTIAEAVLIVLVVIYLSLGSFRAALVPSIAVPLSLIGAGLIMLVLGFSLNLLTLLAMVLAIGLVVDDAIIVVENIHRHVEEGYSKFDAAIMGARELAVPIIAMTTTLVAVYAPIGFMGGLVGTLFTEFAFTLAGAVIVSGIVALTLSPMITGKVLKPHGSQGRFEQLVERFFNALAGLYKRALGSLLQTRSVPLLFGLAILCSIPAMWLMSQSELAPTEDQSIIFTQGTAPQTATLDYLQVYADDIQEVFESFPEYKESFMILGRGGPTVFGGFKMESWADRERSQMDLQGPLQGRLQSIAGLQMVSFPRPSIPGSSGGLPVQFVITTGQGYDELDQVASELVGRGMQSGNFAFLKKSSEIDRPVTNIRIDRDRAGDLGITMQEIGSNLAALLGEGYINRFSLEGRSYKVIPQVERRFRLDQQMLEDYYIRGGSGDLVPLSNLVTFEREVEPSQRAQFNQLNSVTVEGVATAPLGQALGYLESQAEQIFPRGFTYDFTGQSRQYAQQGSALLVTFFLSLLVIYLVLAAQFESWRDPLIILVSVPMSIAGALAFIFLGAATVNIYTQVGLITLIGVVAKNGILIVEFSNNLQIREGYDKFKAVVEGSAIRLRPIIMTSIALIVAMVPLLIAAGPGAVSRFHIGLTIATGLGIGTLFTLFVLPAVYLLLAKDHNADGATAQSA
ncbi:efflux RND transporter permease subunit [Ectothiorhodospiraceae bacterium WFHF3C12]|nr:efflux RND transporter permease subunit [Ectothiorhodospiraceae bacterium WFHF3C12]